MCLFVSVLSDSEGSACSGACKTYMGGELKDSDDFQARLKCFLEKRLLKDLVKRS